MSNGSSEMFERLTESVGPLAKLPNNGASYHTGEQIITHLNRALGPDKWSFHVLETGEESDSDECWAYVQITAIINGETVVKQDYGSQAFKKVRATGKYVSKWDDKKAAITDALKRCARLFGVGLDAWANERAPSWRPEIDDDAPPKGGAGASGAPASMSNARTTAPSNDATAPAITPDVAASAVLTGAPESVQQRWARLVAEAERVKYPKLAQVKAIAANSVSAKQLTVYADQLEGRLSEAKGAA